MATIKIDNKEYDLDTLSDECKAQLASIQFVVSETPFKQLSNLAPSSFYDV